MFDRGRRELLYSTLFLRGFGLRHIPLLYFVGPSVVELNDESYSIKLPFRRRNRNHLGSMYFGAIAIGADCAAAFGAFLAIRERKAPVSLIFKDFEAKFLKRIEGDCILRCDERKALGELVDEAIETKERVERRIEVVLRVPSRLGDEVAARCWLTVSLKAKSKS